MKDIILDRLSKMEDLEQRKLLKNIMSGFFSNLIDYQTVANKNLETRIFEEIVDVEKKYDVFVTICHKNDVDPVDEFLFPVFPEDVEDKKIDMTEIMKKLYKNEDVTLCTIFMKCDYPTLKELVKSKKKYVGEIVTDKRKYKIRIKLEQNMKYINQMDDLYGIFQRNSIPWKTINNPYSNRFFDIVLTECEGLADDSEEIQEINFDLEEYEKYKCVDIVLLWNIKRLSIKGDGFPMPAIDKVNFEHAISLKKLKTDNGYLVDGEEKHIKYIKRTEEELIIVSPEEKAGAWNIIKISQQFREQTRNIEYAMVSNRRKVSFINKYAHSQSSIIRTKGEIVRIANSFESSEGFALEDIEIRASRSGRSSTYDMNSFIVDDIRVGNDKKVMNLKFTSSNKNSSIVYDLLSFIVSEIQLYFPEYECEGELL